MDKVPAPIKSREDLLIARRAAGLSQGDLAGHMRMTQHAISKVETGVTALTERFAAHAALVLAWCALPSVNGTLAVASAPRSPGRPSKVDDIDPAKPRWRRRTMAGGRLEFLDACRLPVGSQYQLSCCVGTQPWSDWLVYERSMLAPYPENDKLIGDPPPSEGL